MHDNDNPKNWREGYDKIAIFKVHDSIWQIKKCPVCQGVIDREHREALSRNNIEIVEVVMNEEKGFVIR